MYDDWKYFNIENPVVRDELWQWPRRHTSFDEDVDDKKLYHLCVNYDTKELTPQVRQEINRVTGFVNGEIDEDGIVYIDDWVDVSTYDQVIAVLKKFHVTFDEFD